MSEISVNHPRIKAVNEFHELAIHSAKNAMLYAVKAGAELLALKEEVGHGNFEATCKRAFPFSKMTVCRYMTVAQQVSKVTHVLHLDRAPETKLLSAIHSVSQAANISGLYKDLGIIKDQRVAKRAQRHYERATKTDDDRQREAFESIQACQFHMANAMHHWPLLPEASRAILAWLAVNAIKGLLPDGEYEVTAPISGEKFTLDKWCERHFGPRPKSNA